MTVTPPVKVPYLTRRKKSGPYQFERRIPRDLVSVFGRPLIRVTLGTSDYRTACTLCRSWAVDWDRAFAQARAELARSAPVSLLDPTLRDRFADLPESVQRAIAVGQVSQDLPANKPPATPQEARQRAIAHIQDIRARHRLARLLGHDPSPGELAAASLSPDLPPVLQFAAVQAADNAARRHEQRIAAELADMKAAARQRAASSFATPAGRDRTLADVIPEWQAGKKPKDRAVENARRAVRLFQESGGTVALARLDRDMGVRFRNWLQDPAARGFGGSAAKNHWSAVNVLLNYAANDLRWLSLNPWAGLSVTRSRGQARPPWYAEQLTLMVQSPLFSRYELPTVKKAGGAAAYWVPLLALYSGAREGELLQLRTDDLLHRDGIPCFSVNDTAEGNTVKTAAGIREVPVHSELLRLGFLEYVAALPHGKLFPAVPSTATRDAVANFSDWFRCFRRGLKLTARYPDFHSFRHTARTSAKGHRADEELLNALFGHESTGSTGARDYTHATMEFMPAALAAAIECIQYPVTFPRVYPASPHTP